MPYKGSEAHKEYDKAWKKDNPDKVKAALDRYRAKPESQEKIKAYRKARYAREREQVLAEHKTQEWRDAHNKRQRERYQNDPELRRKRSATRNANRFKIIPEELEAFKAMYDQPCFYCGDDGGAVDHLMPRSRGGEDRLYNLVPCCKPCNSSKGAKTPEEWYASRPLQQ